jgi:acetyl esterase
MLFQSFITRLSQATARRLWRNAASLPDSARGLVATQEKFVKMNNMLPALEKHTPRKFRFAYRHLSMAFGSDKSEVSLVEDRVVESKQSSFKVRIYRTEAALKNTSNAALVYFHGGGGVIGDLDTHDDFCRYIANNTDIIVISVDYRLAPEYPFPIPVEDSIRGWNWVCENNVELGIDLSRCGVGGDSAGGFMAASVCQQALQPVLSDRPLAMPSFQWLIYPMLDARLVTSSSKLFTQDLLLTRSIVLYFYDHLLPSHIDRSSTLASPILVKELAGLPPTYIATVGFDPLKDEGNLYAINLKQQHVAVVSDHFNNVMHGCIGIMGVCPTSKSYADVMLKNLRALTQ